MKAALVIMAAGMGSRYGGSKQVDGIGPDGEILMEYSIYDAIRAGFTKVVFIIKPEMRELVETLCGRRVAGMTAADGSPVEVCYAYQDFSSVPAFYSIPAERTKPFGTGHAVLCARSCVGEPFIVINADDYYGVDAFRVIYEELGRLEAEGEATMVGYRLDKTVSEHGSVTRGVCHVTDGNTRPGCGDLQAHGISRRHHPRRGQKPGGRRLRARYAGVHEFLGLYAVDLHKAGGIL